MSNLTVFSEEPILLVDDTDEYLQSVYMTLKSEGFTQVKKCLDSREVIAILKQKRYSLVILDILMPYIRGDELLPQILDEQPDIKVIMLTAIHEVKIAVECMHVGVVDYLVKPVEKDVLIKKIMSLLKGRSQ